MHRFALLVAGTLLLGLAGNGFGQPAPLLSLTNSWRFDQTGADLGTRWTETAYNDSGWPQANALFYTANASVPAPQNTVLAATNAAGQPITTYYFRTHFSFSGSATGFVLVATNYLQAGAVFYLNGVELDRFRLANGTITASAFGFAGPEAQPNVLVFPATALVAGDNVLAVEVHQASEDSINRDVVFGLSLTASATPPPLPDLVIWGPSVTAHFEVRTFYSNDCEVLDGCAVPGARTLLRFATQTRNAGTADLVLGNPTNNPLFEYDPCHHHYHFEGYVAFRLLNTNGALVATGKKIGFALVDGERWDTNANPSDFFSSVDQGIQHGWADLYDYLLPCQFVDITGVPPGFYTLELEVDPNHKLPELNETNNVTRVNVSIPPNPGVCVGAPSNDLFTAAQVVPYRVASAVVNTDCATRETGEPAIINNPGGRSVWFRWTAPETGTVTIDTEGSDFDTILGLYSGTDLANLTAIAGDDDSGAGRTSRIVTNITAGTVYSIAVDGYDSPELGPAYSGNAVMNINANGNDFFAAAQPLAGMAGSILGSTFAATKEPGEPNHAGNPGGHSIWYSWTALFAGPVAFDTSASRFHTLLAVYSGVMGSLSAVAGNDGSFPDGASRVAFQAVAGMTYYIAVDGYDGAAGLCALNWRPALRLVAPASANGALQFTLSGLAGDRCLIEVSGDLADWTAWQRVTNTTGSMLLVAPIDASKKFFRARVE